MMKRAVLCAMTLLALGTAAFGAAVSGVSNTFGIDNTLGTPDPVAAGALNPYVVSAGDLLRGQIHAHYLDDGPGAKQDSDPPTVAGDYHDLGYNFVSLTEHNVITPPPTVNGIIITPYCEEATTDPTLPYWGSRGPGHILALGMNSSADVVPWGYSTNEPIPTILSRVVRTVHANGGLAILAHPEWGELHTPKLLAYLWEKPEFGSQGSSIAPYPEGISIFNAASPARNDATELWNGLLDRGVRTWGFAEDDYTPGLIKAQDCAGRTWVGVPFPAGTVTWTDIRNKLTTGNFYTYWMEGKRWPAGQTPPQVSINVTSGEGGRPRISVSLSGVEPLTPGHTPFLDFIGAKHWDGIIRTRRWTGYIPYDSTYEYQCNGREDFIRVFLTLPYSFGTLKITSQPIVIYRTGNPYMQGMAFSSNRVSAASTSTELHLRYLEPLEKPSAFPPSGYIGDAVNVTTQDGLVPPDATLELSYDGEDTSAIGGTQYLAIYRYDTGSSAWAKVGGTVDPGTATIEASVTQLGYYTISADLSADTTAPEVFIDNPPYGGIVNMDTTIRATVNDDLGAWRVSFYLNDHLLLEDADALDFWTADIPIANYCEGDWTLQAVAEDLAGNTGTAEIPIHIHSSTPPPTVAITSPTGGANLSGTVTTTGTCGDDVAVALVTLRMDNTVVGFGEVTGTDWTCDIDTTYLVDGVRTLTATVEDYPGNEATASVLVNIANGGTVAIGSLKSLSTGAAAKFSGAIVVAGTDLVGNGFYAEDVNRMSGIRVVTDRAIQEKDLVSIAGMVTTVGTEKAIQAYDIAVLSSNNTLPDPLGMSGKLLLSPSLDAIGKIVTVWGKVTGADTANPARWFTISDGSPMDVKCSVPLGVTAPTTGFYQVTGVCSVDPDTGSPLILLRGPDDLVQPQ
ncbi:MAG: Ig-like domain-containing protein [Armatimonadota bacterium]|nr:Ig-like domain-containing protein [Armatimonadota bacterium]